MEPVARCDQFQKTPRSPLSTICFLQAWHGDACQDPQKQHAVHASIQVVRAFVGLREMLAYNAALARKLNVLEQKYDTQFKVVFEAIRRLMIPPGTQTQINRFWGKTEEIKKGHRARDRTYCQTLSSGF